MLIILTAGAVACVLLAIRQQRIEAAHEMWQIHNRMIAAEQLLWDLRAQLFRQCDPSSVRRLVMSSEHEWIAIPMPAHRSAALQQSRAQLAGDEPTGVDLGG